MRVYWYAWLCIVYIDQNMELVTGREILPNIKREKS